MFQAFLMAAAIMAQSKDDPSDLIKAYAKLDLDSKAKAERSEVVFDDASKERIVLEHRLVACGATAVKPLVEALKSENAHVRAMAAELLGIIGDKTAPAALANAGRGDSSPTVRLYAIQSLAWLKSSADVIKAAEKDSNANVQFVAKRGSEQLKSVARPKDAFGTIVKPDEMNAAEVGKKAPDFALPSADGKTWKLSEQKGLVVLMFQLADW